MEVTKRQVLEASKGMLQLQLYVVFSTPANGVGPVMKNLEAHLAHQCKIEAEGIMFAAGPHWTDDEEYWNGEGMFVIRADSLAHARELAASDPMHLCGARTFKVRPWLINEGGLTAKLSFSDGKMVLK
jgi:uncharacterized protein YciI